MTLYQPVEFVDVCGSWLIDEFWMSCRVFTFSVCAWVKGNRVTVMDLFFIFNLVEQFDGIGSTAKECFVRVERWHDVEFINKLFHLKVSIYH